MKKFSKDSFVDFNKYQEHLSYTSRIYLNQTKLFSFYLQVVYKRDAYFAMVLRHMQAMSSGKYYSLGRESIYYYLLTYENCPEYIFKTHKTQAGWTLNRKTVLEPLYNKGYAHEFLSLYLEYLTYKQLESSVRALLDKHTFETDVVGNSDEILRVCPFSVQQQQNFRYNYNKHDIITIPKKCNKAVTAPKGKILVWGDFAQADLRAAYNLYIRDAENMKIVTKYDDMYEAMARIIRKDKFDREEFLAKRNLMKAVILSCVYGKRSDVEEDKTEFLKEFGEYLDHHCPKYMEYKRRIQQNKEFRDVIYLDTYFGHSLMIDQRTASYGNANTIEHQCLNYPIQSCTSLIVILTVNAILDQFYSLGYTEEQVGVYYTRHDEPIFVMDKDVMKDSWVFYDYNKIFVDDWYPMQLDFSFGYSYKLEDDELTDLYQKCVDKNKDKIRAESMNPKSPTDFYPLKTVYSVAIGTFTAHTGECIVALYDREHGQAHYLKLDSNDRKKIQATLAHISDRVKQGGYCGLCALNSDENREFSHDGLVYRYKKTFNSDVGMAFALAEHMAYKYAKREGVELSLSNRCLELLDSILEVKTVECLLSVKNS